MAKINFKEILFPRKKLSSSKQLPDQDPAGAAGNVSPAADFSSNQAVQPGQKINTGVPFSSSKPKRKFPLTAIVVPVVLIVLLIVAGLIFRLLSNRSTTFGVDGEIVWWGLTDAEIVQPLIDEYVSENEGITITYVQQSSVDYGIRLRNSLAKGQGPDIFEFHNTWVPMMRNELSVNPQNIFSNSEYESAFYPVVPRNLALGSGYSGVPLGLDTLIMYVNSGVFTAAATDVPSRWSEYFDVAKHLTQKPDGNTVAFSGAAIGTTENVDNWQEILGLLLKQNGADFNTPDSEKMISVIEFYASFAERDKTWDETLPSSTTTFARGRLAILIAPIHRNDEIRATEGRVSYFTAKPPQLPKDDPLQKDVGYATYWVQGVWSKTVNEQDAWRFLKFLSEPDSLREINKNYVEIGKTPLLYPRPEMSNLQINDPILGPAVELLPDLTFWYLAGDTNDGEDGINSRIQVPFETVISEAAKGRNSSRFIKNFADEITVVLNSYGIR